MLRRSPLKRSGSLTRKKPMRRTSFKRSPRKPRPGDDPVHLAFIRLLHCAACGRPGPNDPHHVTYGRAFGRKAPDIETLPLCRRCHDNFHAARDAFADWSREKRRTWQKEAATFYRQFSDFPVLLLVRVRDGWEAIGAYATEEAAEQVWTRAARELAGRGWSWIGSREEAARMLADPEYVPTEKSA